VGIVISIEIAANSESEANFAALVRNSAETVVGIVAGIVIAAQIES
jgi:hypothetical protein